MDLTDAGAVVSQQERQSQPSPKSAYALTVDPFLVEALQNPRHRLTVLRMERDILNFLQNHDQNQFEFPHFPSSYLRLAAHRVAQHYDLQTMVQDNVVDGIGNRIFIVKKLEHEFPLVCLADIPAKDMESENRDAIRIVIKPKCKDSAYISTELALKGCQVRTIEERMEEYDKARARIFSSTDNKGSEGESDQVSPDTENSSVDGDKGLLWNRETSNTCRAILRDREKDRTDPDYDRSYDRYARSGQSFTMLPPFHAVPPFVQYGLGFLQRVQTPPLPNYAYSASDSSDEACLHMQWPTQSMMHDQLSHGFFQAPFFQQQPLSFHYSQNYHR